MYSFKKEILDISTEQQDKKYFCIVFFSVC